MYSANDNDKTIKAGVIGYPIKHSLSPIIHRYWLEKYNILGTYDAIEVKPEELHDFLDGLKDNGFSGINITLPHKENTMEYVSNVGVVEKIIGAINTVYVTESGKLDGNNTDYYGFYKNLKQHAPRFNFKAGKAVVLGAGGASRAVCAALLGLCEVPELIIINRSRERAEALKDDFYQRLPQSEGKIIVIDWDNRELALENANILVNTTSLGMEGQDELHISLERLPKHALVTDIVYRPLKTEILIEAEKRGNEVVDGIGMLLHQAVLGFFKWYGVEPEVTEDLRIHVLEHLKNT